MLSYSSPSFLLLSNFYPIHYYKFIPWLKESIHPNEMIFALFIIGSYTHVSWFMLFTSTNFFRSIFGHISHLFQHLFLLFLSYSACHTLLQNRRVRSETKYLKEIEYMLFYQTPQCAHCFRSEIWPEPTRHIRAEQLQNSMKDIFSDSSDASESLRMRKREMWG